MKKKQDTPPAVPTLTKDQEKEKTKTKSQIPNVFVENFLTLRSKGTTKEQSYGVTEYVVYIEGEEKNQ